MTQLSRTDHRRKHAEVESIGCIDQILDGFLYGWIAVGGRGAEKATPIRVSLLLDGSVQATVDADMPRPDVVAANDTMLNCGFAIPLPELEVGRTHRISAICSDTGYSFNDEKIRWCPLVHQMRDQLQRLFVPGYYCNRYSLEHLDDASALDHYLKFGIYSDFDPNPWFHNEFVRSRHSEQIAGFDLPILAFISLEHELLIDTSAQFQTSYYHAMNPDLNAGSGLFDHYVNHGYKEGRRTEPSMLPARLRSELVDLTVLEPKLPQADGLEQNVFCYPQLSATTWEAGRLRGKFSDEIEAIVCMPFVGLGGADLVGTFVLRALQEEFGIEHVLLVLTEDRCVDKQARIASDTRVHCLDSTNSNQDIEHRSLLLHEIVGTLAPERVINVNSHACWEMSRRFGRQLSAHLELVAYLFCFEYAPNGRLGGYIGDYLPQTLPFLKTVIFDNEPIIRELMELYGFPPSQEAKFVAVRTPILEPIVVRRPVSSGETQPERVLWIGRLARQKRPDRMLAIAERLPSVEFVIYGLPGDASCSDDVVRSALPNLDYRGSYEHPDDIDPNEFAILMYTADWDGLPTILIQHAAARLPILTTLVGGIGDLITEDTGWGVRNPDDIDAWVDCIHRILMNPEQTNAKVEAAADLVEDLHNWATYRDGLRRAGLFSIPPPSIDTKALESRARSGQVA